MEKDNEFAFEIRRIYQVATTHTVSIVIGALGTIDRGVVESLSYLEIPYIFACTQMTVILGTAVILRRALSL